MRRHTAGEIVGTAEMVEMEEVTLEIWEVTLMVAEILGEVAILGETATLGEAVTL